MKRRRRLTRDDQVEIVRRFCEELEPAISIAAAFGVTRQAVYRALQRNGVDTEKRKYPTTCANCGAELMRTRQRLRDRERQFCDRACYYNYIEKVQPGTYRQWRHGQRLARAIVAKRFNLQPGNVVHHIDRDTGNNDIRNLMVFASGSDHLRYHRSDASKPMHIWEGAQAARGNL